MNYPDRNINENYRTSADDLMTLFWQLVEEFAGRKRAGYAFSDWEGRLMSDLAEQLYAPPREPHEL